MVGVAVVAVRQDHAVRRGILEEPVHARLVLGGVGHVALGVFGKTVEAEVVGGQPEARATLALLGLAGGRLRLPALDEHVLDTARTARQHLKRDARTAIAEMLQRHRHHIEVVRMRRQYQPVAHAVPGAGIRTEDGWTWRWIHAVRRRSGEVAMLKIAQGCAQSKPWVSGCLLFHAIPEWTSRWFSGNLYG